MPQGKTQKVELRGRSRKQEITLVALRIGGPPQLGAAGSLHTLHIMSGCQRRRPKLAGGVQQIVKFYPLVAADTRDWRRSCKVGVGEILHHRLAEPVFVVQDIVRNVEPLGDATRIVDILAGTAGALAA